MARMCLNRSGQEIQNLWSEWNFRLFIRSLDKRRVLIWNQFSSENFYPCQSTSHQMEVKVKTNPAGKNLFKVRKITLEQRSLKVVLTLFCWLWTGFGQLGKGFIFSGQNPQNEKITFRTLNRIFLLIFVYYYLPRIASLVLEYCYQWGLCERGATIFKASIWTTEAVAA